MFESARKIRNFPSGFQNKYEISDQELDALLKALFESGEGESLDEVIAQYLVEPSVEVETYLRRYLKTAEEGVVEDRKSLEKNVVSACLALSLVQRKNFPKIARVYSRVRYQENGLRKALLKQTILENTIQTFNDLTISAMSQTQQSLLSSIRRLQKDLILESQALAKYTNVDGLLDMRVREFRQALQMKYPKVYKAIEGGGLISSSGKVYKADQYIDSAARSILLNADRDSVEAVARVKQHSVLDYYLRDNRPVKTGKERKICKDVLVRKIMGYSLVALTRAEADRLGIYTLDEVKERGGLGYNCRHSIRSLPAPVLKEIMAVLKEAI
ncbi:MAG: hypothetical protein PF637_06015 [Spirochaetes bacterium]|jgi:hypothetical protein|nr:hypothetical protein [Spirochaetota bacterium]